MTFRDVLIPGSPVRTGIDLIRVTMIFTIGRFPRTHGDRPIKDIVIPIVKMVPPYARG